MLQAEIAIYIRELMSRLTDAEIYVIDAYFFRKETLRDAGATVHHNDWWAHQIKKRALAKMRKKWLEVFYKPKTKGVPNAVQTVLHHVRVLRKPVFKKKRKIVPAATRYSTCRRRPARRSPKRKEISTGTNNIRGS
jgi:hypothetical protein